MDFIGSLKSRLASNKMTIVLPEGSDERIVGAAVKLKNEGILEPIVLGTKEEIENAAKLAGVDASVLTTINPPDYEDKEALVQAFLEKRKGKITEEDARKLVDTNNNYFGTLLIYTNKADGMVSGAIHSTGDTLRPPLQIIGTNKAYSLVSGLFVMIRDDDVYFFADCAINISPEPAHLAEFAAQTDETAKKYGFEPKIAMLSFSTNGSGNSPVSDKIAEAVKIAKEKYPHINVDGEMQFDAAYVEKVGKSKFPGSEVAGKANAFIFPDLNSGNIGYKIAQRLGNFEAVGPICQGMAAPVNDLSRGCSMDDVYSLSIITAVQALKNE